jgi:hypothetical protein
MADEMPSLTLEALRLAEEARTSEKIGRLGRILVHASAVGPRDGAQMAEEMLRLAMVVSEDDIRVLWCVIVQNDQLALLKPHDDRLSRGFTELLRRASEILLVQVRRSQGLAGITVRRVELQCLLQERNGLFR